MNENVLLTKIKLVLQEYKIGNLEMEDALDWIESSCKLFW